MEFYLKNFLFTFLKQLTQTLFKHLNLLLKRLFEICYKFLFL